MLNHSDMILFQKKSQIFHDVGEIQYIQYCLAIIFVVIEYW